MSHDSHTATPATRALPHVPEAGANDIAVSHRTCYERERRHAADSDAPSAPAASSGPRVSHDAAAWGGQNHRIISRCDRFDPFDFAFPPAAASPFIRLRRGSTRTLPTAPSIPKSSQVSSNKNQVGRHLSPLPRLLYLMLACFDPPLTCRADKDTAANTSNILIRPTLIAGIWLSQG